MYNQHIVVGRYINRVFLVIPGMFAQAGGGLPETPAAGASALLGARRRAARPAVTSQRLRAA